MSAAADNLGYRFRPMQEEDLGYVLSSETRAYSHPWTLGIFRDCLRAGYNCWVAELDGRVVGHCIMSVAVGETHILNICVDPDFQGRGLGRRLLLHLLDIARQYGAKIALLEVRPSNVQAIHLYETLGFSEVGQRKAYYPSHEGREDAIVMALGLEDFPGAAAED